ncbi:MAG: discoidin domain-containing protein [Thermoguttaceae bacterium]|nr:discoidin domain-containing protein [Thermoguttaceae bacterium]MDW8077859.1 discoidin domain-containing protein [Thermoguttaceae bacterium]
MCSLSFIAFGLVAVMALGLGGTAWAEVEPRLIVSEIRADRAFEISFAPRLARCVRLIISRSFRGEPCVDELEVYSPEREGNIALAERGALASASSCLPGYRIHRIEHLNDGRYGNDHSWIAASSGEEWAQISLPEPVRVDRVVISRDRRGKYHDRLPTEMTVQISTDGQSWEVVARVVAQPWTPESAGPVYTGPVQLPARASYEELVVYAFQCERHSWSKISDQDHLSPLRSDRPAVPDGPPYWGRLCRMEPVERTLFLFEELLERLAKKGVDVSAEEAELGRLCDRWKTLRAQYPRDLLQEERLYLEARWAKRRAIFRDPELAPLRRLLFVKRHPYHCSHNYSDILDSEFRPGGGVFILEIPLVGDRLEPGQATLRQVFDASAGIARDPVADFEARRIYFAYRPAFSTRPGWQPYWHLMVVDEDGKNLQQLTDGPFHDYYPCPLPDGHIAFISTRIKSRYLCWRPQVFVLFRMRPDGSDIRPLSFANLSEWSPTVLADGRILWTKSEYLDKGADFGHTLWAIRPDGSHPELIYGNNTPNCYLNAREMPGTKELCCTLISHGGDHNGPIALIDRRKGPFDPGAIVNITPDVTPQYNMNWLRWECFRDPYPVTWEYILVSHAPGDRFGLYVIDRYGNRELLYLDPAIGSMSPSVLAPRLRPPVLPAQGDADLFRGNKAVVTVVDVYAGITPPVKRGQARYLRICEEVRSPLEALPDGQYRWDHEPFMDYYASPTHLVQGPYGWPSYVAKGVVGLVELGEDGSATFEVPAGKMLYFQLLDSQLNELQRMRSVVQFASGERRGCIGCHEDRRTAPPPVAGFAGGQLRPVLPPPWGAGPFSYERVVQPVLDRHCANCHDHNDPRGINLTGIVDSDLIPASYRTLIAGGWVHYFDYHWNLRHHKAEPMTFGTLRSRLWEVLDKGHYGVELSREDVHALKCWIDLNCPLWPDYQFRPARQVTKLIGRD